MGRIVLAVLLLHLSPLLRGGEVIHVFVALADNASQGIVPVPAKIGNGDDPGNNLYWGCSEGVRSWFAASKRWKKVSTPKPSRAEILERIVFRHKEKDAWLVADAWRGREIKLCLEAFAGVLAGQGGETLQVGDKIISVGGNSSLMAYIGHDGLMDFSIDWPVRASPGTRKPAIVLCCKSADYFNEHVNQVGAVPLLSTTQLMYPGAFVLHDALEVWLAGGSADAVRQAAGKAYAKNQSISVKAATGVFAAPPPASPAPNAH